MFFYVFLLFSLILIKLCDFRYNYYEKVKTVLGTLSKSSAKHKEANIEWLKSKLQQAEDTNNHVWEWINKCNAAVNENIN